MSESRFGTRDLELAKAVLTNTMQCPEPDRMSADFGVRFVDHYFRGRALTCVPRCRLDHLEACIRTVVDESIPGDLIETGVWRGGVTIFMRMLLETLGVNDRIVWVADSFRGLPRPDKTRFPRERAAFDSPEMAQLDYLKANAADVASSFAAFGLLDDQVRFLEGWFADTLPSAPIDKLAVLRLDGDFYESTLVALSALYDKVSSGGYVVVDDYGEDWTHCREAVDEFRRTRGIRDTMHRVDAWCSYWRRS